MTYKVTASNHTHPQITEVFRYRYFALKAAKSALKVYMTVKIEREESDEQGGGKVDAELWERTKSNFLS